MLLQFGSYRKGYAYQFSMDAVKEWIASTMPGEAALPEEQKK